jgi:hypothetical protein
MPADVPADVTWQVARHQLRAWLQEDDGAPRRPWIVLVVGANTGMALGTSMELKRPTAANILRAIVNTTKKPAIGRPHRPSLVVCADPDLVEGLRPGLEALGIRCEDGEVANLESALDSLDSYMTKGEGPPPLTEAPGVTDDLLARFFGAAAHFHRAAPWRHVGDDAPIAIRVPATADQARFAVVMGGGLEYGLAVYRSLADLDMAYSGASPDELLEAFDHEAVTYGQAHEMAIADLEAAEQHGWEIAGPRAHPLLMHIARDGELQAPSADDLRWYTAALLAVPQFVEHHLLPAIESGRGSEVVLSLELGGEEVTVSLRHPPAPERRRPRRRGQR